MDNVKKCSKCRTFFPKPKFFNDITKKDVYRPSCKICCQKFYNNQNRILNNHKYYNKKNRSKINLMKDKGEKLISNFN